MDSSTFFTSPEEIKDKDQYTILRVSRFNTLYSMEREGRRFVAKALSVEHRGDMLFESLLRKEFEIGYSLHHLNICHTYSFEQHAELGNVIIMEWLDGRTLDEYADEEHSTEELRRVALQLCDALSYAHKKQTIHRDLKPQNIIITYNGDNVKLLDFGLSDTSSHTTLKEPAGSRKYASPELLAGGEVDIRADIYSLGVVLDELFAKHKSKRIAKIVARATSFYPTSRYPNAESLATALCRRSVGLVYPILIIILTLIGYLFFTINRNSESLIPSAKVDRVSVEEFEQRQKLCNNFFSQINNSYTSIMYDMVYRTSCATPEMPNFEELSRMQITHYEKALDSMMGKIKHSSLYISARRNITSHNDELFNIMRNSFPAMFWLNSERLFRQASDSLALELKKLPTPSLSSLYDSMSHDSQLRRESLYRKEEAEYKKSTVKIWAIAYRKERNLSPLSEDLLNYYK